MFLPNQKHTVTYNPLVSVKTTSFFFNNVVYTSKKISE